MGLDLSRAAVALAGWWFAWEFCGQGPQVALLVVVAAAIIALSSGVRALHSEPRRPWTGWLLVAIGLAAATTLFFPIWSRHMAVLINPPYEAMYHRHYLLDLGHVH